MLTGEVSCFSFGLFGVGLIIGAEVATGSSELLKSFAVLISPASWSIGLVSIMESSYKYLGC